MAHIVDHESVEDANMAVSDARDEPIDTFLNEDKYLSDELISLDGSDDDDDDDDDGNTYPQFNKNAQFGHISLEISMEFADLDTFKDAIRDYSIYLGRHVAFPKNDLVRCRALCLADGCKWVCLCSFSNQTKSYLIKTLHDEHTCYRQVTNKLANREWCVKKLVLKLREQPNMKGKEAHNHIKVTYGVIVPDHLIFPALKEAREVIEGSEKEQYARLIDYGSELLRTNPGSTIEIVVQKMPPNLIPIFDKFYVCLEACKKGFVNGCRPLIGLDGYFLKGYHKGELLAAMAQDGNNGFYPIAYAIVESETKESWKWFLTMLFQDIGHPNENGWNFISHQSKGLLPAMEELHPNAEHRFCTRHIWENFKRQWKGKKYRDNYWPAVKCTTMNDFNKYVSSIRRLNDKAGAYLDKRPPSSWSRAAISTYPKNDTLVNNACEQFNAAIVSYRSHPILTMVEEIRCYIMRKMNDNRYIMNRYQGLITPRAKNRLDLAKRDSMWWTLHWAGDPDGNKFEVTTQMGFSDRVLMDLGDETCSCRLWQISGIPCKHAIAAMSRNKLKLEDYVHNSYSMATFKMTYTPFINPVSGQEYWAKIDAEPIHPPKYGRPGGHQRTKRLKKLGQAGNPYKLARKYGKTKCSTCPQEGHNARRCTTSNRKSVDEAQCSQVATDPPPPSQSTSVVD